MSKTVNGPYNIVRLEGYVNGKKKIIYLFSDLHAFDYECDDIDSLDINKYLLKVFRKAKKKLPNIHYDFFVETFTRPEHENLDKVKRYNYLLLVRKIFYHLTRKKRILSDEMNIRLHYTDFRDYLSTYEFYNMALRASEETHHMFSDISLDSSYINNIINILKPLPNKIKYIQYLINTDLVKVDIKDKTVYLTPGNITKKESNNILTNIFVKIKYEYINNHIKSKLAKILVDLNLILNNILDKHKYLLNFLANVRKDNTSYLDYATDSKDSLETITDIKICISDMSVMCSHVSAILIDIFMLRRFLDKDYITNAIYYCGGDHANFITTALIQYFDFKITHIAKSEHTIDELNKQLNKVNIHNTLDMRKLLKTSYQCSSLENFPELLT